MVPGARCNVHGASKVNPPCIPHPAPFSGSPVVINIVNICVDFFTEGGIFF